MLKGRRDPLGLRATWDSVFLRVPGCFCYLSMEARIWPLFWGDAFYIDRSNLLVFFSRGATYCRRLLSTPNMAGEFEELAFRFYFVLTN